MYNLNICHLYPDILNHYGDRGNVIALEKRCIWRGIQVNISNVSLGDAFESCEYDIIFLGGGENYEQKIVLDDLIKEKGNEIKNAINNDKVFLAICGGYQFLGKYIVTQDKRETELLG